MSYPQKIATCCYCGTRAALVLKGKVRHELACANCGAPLHDLKRLPVDRKGDRELVERVKPAWNKNPKKPIKPRKKKKSRRKSFFKDALEEAFDFFEDIFD